MSKSPYLRNDDRLNDVISAIQTLGTYRFYRMSPQKWSERICGDESQAEKWCGVFRDHPEFFRFSSDDKSVSLVLRRQKPKLFDVDSLKLISRDDRVLRNAEGRARISRSPLSEGELQLLIGLATNFHSKALEDRRDGRWWTPIATTVIAALIGLGGVVLGSMLDDDRETSVEIPCEAAEPTDEVGVEDRAAE